MAIPAKVARQLNNAVKDRARGKALEDEAKILIEGAKNVLLPLMSAYDIETYELKGVGKVGRRLSKGSSINKGKLRENLLIEGIDIAVIDKVIESSSSVWSKEYVQFNVEKS